MGLCYFLGRGDSDFEVWFWVQGTAASLCNIMGSTFAIAALSTGAPMGPSSALINSQTIFVTIITAIWTKSMPLTM